MEQETRRTSQGTGSGEEKYVPSDEMHAGSGKYTASHVGHFLKNLRDMLEVLLFYIGLPLTTLYPVAVLFYWGQIRANYDTDFEASWHAALLIPKNFAMIEIIRSLTLGASEALLIIGIIALAVFFLEKEGGDTSSGRRERVLSRLPKRDHVRDVVRVLVPFLGACAAIGISAYIVVFVDFPGLDDRVAWE